MVSQVKLQNPFCFSNITHLTVVLCAFYHIHTVGNFTIETLVYFPFLLVYSKWFCFFYIRAGCAVISTFPHTSLGPFWIRFRICWYFSSYKMVLYIPLALSIAACIVLSEYLYSSWALSNSKIVFLYILALSIFWQFSNIMKMECFWCMLGDGKS